MKKTGALVFILAGFGSFSAVHAEQFGTAEEARAMLDRAIAALNVNQARALSEFNNTKNTQFHDRDLYISCYNTADGKFTAFPSRAMIGADREMERIAGAQVRLIDKAGHLPHLEQPDAVAGAVHEFLTK